MMEFRLMRSSKDQGITGFCTQKCISSVLFLQARLSGHIHKRELKTIYLYVYSHSSIIYNNSQERGKTQMITEDKAGISNTCLRYYSALNKSECPVHMFSYEGSLWHNYIKKTSQKQGEKYCKIPTV